MIKGLFETHIFVEDLERSIDFYKNVLGLTPGNYIDERRIAFFWIGEPKTAMLGLWEKPKEQIESRHFAFKCDVDDVLNKSISFLKAANLQPYNFLKDGSEQPMVFAWMPAIAIYFKDPNGHDLEFFAMLEGEGRPELGVISFQEWVAVQPQGYQPNI